MRKILILLFLVLGCSNEGNFVKLTDDLTFEVYEEVYLYDLIDSGNDKISSDNYLIDTSSLGSKQVSYFYNNEEFNFEIKIIDSTKPLIFGGSSYYIELYDEIDLDKILGYGDNYDENLVFKIIGSYDNTQIGSYEVTVSVTDLSLNETKKEIKINVVEEIKSSTNSGLNLSEVIDKHKTEVTNIGIDVSSWQGTIDFNEVKKSGVEFVIIRMGYGHDSNGEIVFDNEYYNNIKKAKEVGLDVGIYFFSYASSEEEAVSQAQFVINTLDGMELELPIVFDWEDWDDFENYNMNFNDINKVAETFLNTIEKGGYQGMLYGSASYLEKVWITEYPVWLAHYTNQTDYEKDYYIWQLSSTGLVPGIDYYTDLNVLYK